MDSFPLSIWYHAVLYHNFTFFHKHIYHFRCPQCFFLFLPVLNLTAISLQDVILLINQPLPCYIKHFHFISYAMHSLPVSISPILTFVVALHCNSFLFLEPFSSRCPPISSNSMMTRPILLTNGTPSRRRTFT